MERKKYLELCQQNAVYPFSKTVEYEGSEHYPMSYELGFEKNGQSTHTAILLDKNKKSVIRCDLEGVDYSEEKNS